MEEFIKHLKGEIEFLRVQNKELMDRVMAFSGQAHQNFLSRDLVASKVPAPTYLDEITGQIVSMEAETEEEKKEQAQALEMLSKVAGV